jgi:hypothetical protein
VQDPILVDGKLTAPQFRYDQLVCYETYGSTVPIGRVVGLSVAMVNAYHPLTTPIPLHTLDVWGYEIEGMDGQRWNRTAWEMVALAAPGNFNQTGAEMSISNSDDTVKTSDLYLTHNGPGKFPLAVDEIAHAATMEGWDSEHEGTDDYAGNIWLVYEVDFTSPDLRYGVQTVLGEGDETFLSRASACVCIEYPSGRFDVEWFVDSDAAKRSYDSQVGGFTLPDDIDGE